MMLFVGFSFGMKCMGEALVLKQLAPEEQTTLLCLSFVLIRHRFAQGDTTHGIVCAALIGRASGKTR
jgi:hypothetical protein